MKPVDESLNVKSWQRWQVDKKISAFPGSLKFLFPPSIVESEINWNRGILPTREKPLLANLL